MTGRNVLINLGAVLLIAASAGAQVRRARRMPPGIGIARLPDIPPGGPGGAGGPIYISGYTAVVPGGTSATTGSGGIHIPAGRMTGWYWNINDGAGYRWDINSNGQVNDGANDAYDGGMQLRVNNSTFSWSSSGRLSADGREVEIGPWNQGSVRVWRRIYVDPKLGYCRWIDIFENTSSSEVSLSLRYYSNVGGSVQVVHTTSGKAEPTKRDWGVITGASADSGSSRPALVHIFATRNAKVRPRFQHTLNSDNMYYHVTLKIPAGKTSALFFIEAQRRPYTKAQKFLKNFDVEKELAKVPAPLRKLLANAAGGGISLGDIELPRHAKHDLVVRRDGTSDLLGAILNERFVVQTFFGKLDLPAGRVLGLCVPSAADTHVQVVLTDGQVVAGKLLNAPLRMKLADGNELSFQPGDIKTAAFRISTARPKKITFKDAVVVLRSGERLAFEPDDLFGKNGKKVVFRTAYGDVTLRARDLRAVVLDTPEGGLHRAFFRNGSVLSGLLDVRDLQLRLKLRHTLAIRRHAVSQFVFPNAVADSTALAGMTLRNENFLLGRLADESLVVRSQAGKVTVKAGKIAQIDFAENALGRVVVTMHDGSTVSGSLAGRVIRFRIDPGPELAVFVGHIRQITCPKSAASEAGGDTSATRPSPPPIPPASGNLSPRERLERKKIQAELAALCNVQDALQARRAKLGARAAMVRDPNEGAKLRAALAEFDEQISQVAKRIAELQTRLR